MYKKILVPIDMAHTEKAKDMIAVARKLAGEGTEYLLVNIVHAVPTAAEMAIPLDKVQVISNLVKEPVSLAAPIGDEAESCLGDLIRDEHSPDPEETVMDLNLQEETQRILTTLTPREEKIIRMRFGISEKAEYTLEETGKVFGVTRERIRQIEATALRKLRQPQRIVALAAVTAKEP